jgi:hypothetical protein
MAVTTMPIRWNTFVIRLWNDSSDGSWRGEVVHLQSKESCHFAAWGQVETFIHRLVPDLDAEATTIPATAEE